MALWTEKVRGRKALHVSDLAKISPYGYSIASEIVPHAIFLVELHVNVQVSHPPTHTTFLSQAEPWRLNRGARSRQKMLNPTYLICVTVILLPSFSLAFPQALDVIFLYSSSSSRQVIFFLHQSDIQCSKYA